MLQRLLSDAAQPILRAAGRAAAPPDRADVAALLARLARLAQPSRMLVLVDVSLSMGARLPAGVTRIQLAAAAAAAGANLLPDAASIGLWSFASRLDGPRDHAELLPLRRLGGTGVDQRAALRRVEATLPDRLSGGGTGLYDSVLAGVRRVRASYDPRAVNSVIVFTDGANDDARGISRSTLVATLRSEADPDRPVGVFALGIGSTADLVALRAITAPTGGRAYPVNTPAQVQAALYDGLNRRRPVG